MSDSSANFSAKSAPINRENAGPFDSSEISGARPYIDLGSLKILPRQDLQLRLEVEEQSKRVVAVTLELRGSTLQVQAFAAPRTGGLWHEIRIQLAEQIKSQGGTVQNAIGSFGSELVAQVIVTTPEGQKPNEVRFIGVDGPRWFLRGVISGKALSDDDAMREISDLFRSIVVVRGQIPLPPRELLPLHVPGAPGA